MPDRDEYEETAQRGARILSRTHLKSVRSTALASLGSRRTSLSPETDRLALRKAARSNLRRGRETLGFAESRDVLQRLEALPRDTLRGSITQCFSKRA